MKTMDAQLTDVTGPEQNVEMPLCIATAMKQLETVKLLIERGENVNEISKIGNEQFTPLYVAALQGFTEIAELLIDNGANVNLSSKVGNDESTPLYVAAQRGHSEVVRLLVKKGADINKTMKYREDEFTALFLVAGLGLSESVKLLLELGADLNKTTRKGKTPLDVALCKGRSEVVKVLMEKHPDVNTPARGPGNPEAEKASQIIDGSYEEHVSIADRSKETANDSTGNSQLDVKATVSKTYPVDNKRNEQFAYSIEAHRNNTAKFCRKFQKTSDYISEIPPKIYKSIQQKNITLSRLKMKYSQKLEKKEKEVEQLQNRIDELRSQEGQQERDEVAVKVAGLEGATSQLNSQITELNEEVWEELDVERQISKHQLETQRDELLNEGKRRIEKLESRILELERLNGALLESNERFENLEWSSFEYEEDRNISQSSGNVEASVSVRKVLKFKGTAGFQEAINGLCDKFRAVEESTMLTINNYHIDSSGTVTGCIVGNVGNILANVSG